MPATAAVVVVTEKADRRHATSHAGHVSTRASAGHSVARLRTWTLGVATPATVLIVTDEERGIATLPVAPFLSGGATQRSGARWLRRRHAAGSADASHYHGQEDERRKSHSAEMLKAELERHFDESYSLKFGSSRFGHLSIGPPLAGTVKR